LKLLFLIKIFINGKRMNNYIKNKLKNKIKEASKNKSEYFSFQSTKVSQLENQISHLIHYHSPFSRFESEQDIEKIRKEIRLEKSKFKVKKEYFDLITLEEEIYIKSNKLHFLNLELSLTENYLIIKNNLNYNHLYISLNQGILIEIEGLDEISIKNNELKTTIKIKNIETEYIEDSSVELVINYQKLTLLFIEMFNLILLNKDFY